MLLQTTIIVTSLHYNTTTLHTSALCLSSNLIELWYVVTSHKPAIFHDSLLDLSIC